jgi:homoserine dehydrogenase
VRSLERDGCCDRRDFAQEIYSSMTSVVETLALDSEPACTQATLTQAAVRPATLRIGQLGLGNVGAALARLTARTSAELKRHGLAPVTPVALVRSIDRPRPAAEFVGRLTNDAETFFSHPLDVVVEVIGGVEPAYSLVRRALERGVPVVTANKSLIAAHGEDLSDLARRNGTALRYEASCIAGVPFIGTFERRPLASRIDGLTAILNGTSNTILTAIANGSSFERALEDAQQRGLAEPDPSADVTGRDAAEKLTLLIRTFARLLVTPDALSTTGIVGLDPSDLRAAAALGGGVKPLAHAEWNDGALQAFVGPAFVAAGHPLARIQGATNGIVLRSNRGDLCYTGPGAGPDVTAVTLLDDVCEVATEPRVRIPAAAATTSAAPRWTKESGWFVRFGGHPPAIETSELLGSYGLWCERTTTLDGRLYALTYATSSAKVRVALNALRAATGEAALALPAFNAGEDAC